MKPIGHFILALAVFGFLSLRLVTSSKPIDFHQEKTGDILEFQVLMGKLISFENRHHAEKPALRFALSGATIENIAVNNETSSEAGGDDNDGSEWFTDWSFDMDLGMGGGNGTDNGTTPNTTVNANGTTWNLQMSDNTVVKLKVQDVDNVTHYEFMWPGSDEPNEKRELCLYYNTGSWYNSYQRYQPEWPLNTSHTMPRTPFNYLLNYKNNALNEEFYMILEHLFINSDGYGVMLDDKSPLFIR